MDQEPLIQETHLQQTPDSLESLLNAAKLLQNKHYLVYNTSAYKETALRTILDLGSEAKSNDPTLSNLSKLLSNIKTQLEKLENLQGSYYISSIIKRQFIYYEISNVAWQIEKEIKTWVDRGIVQNVVNKIQECKDEEVLMKALVDFEKRVLGDFDRDLQDLILRAKIFTLLESIVCDSGDSVYPIQVREQCARVVAALVRFNKDVFVGLVLMSRMVKSLVSMASCESIRILTSLVKLIKTPLVDELETIGGLKEIFALLSLEDWSLKVVVVNCLIEIAYFGRKEVIEAMLEEGLVEKFVEFQRSENYAEKYISDGIMESCVVRFAVNVEVGEGMVSKEKRRVKLEILRRVKECCDSDSEAAAIVAEVLWGSSPMNF